MSYSASLPKLQKYFVYAPDQTDEGALDRRYSVRPQHLEAIAKLMSSGVLKFGGILLDAESDQLESVDQRKPIIGSTMIVEAESLNKVKELIESDIYYTAGVWDRDHLVILPFIPATPFS